MKLWIAIVVLMFATVGQAGKAEASYYDGSQLLEWCEGDDANKIACVAYLAGMSDITDTYDNWGVLKERDFCIPDSATLSQLVKVVIKGLNEKPENLHLTASSLVFNIFYKAFPC